MATPAQTSSTCMSQAEARQMFRTSHLYWHGNDHCWDASPSRGTSIARPVRHHEPRAPAVTTTKPSDDSAKASGSVFPVELRQEISLPNLGKWSGTMAMADTIETTPWINRWPDQPIVPPSRPRFAGTAADTALVTPRGIMAVIMTLGLSMALFEIVFGGRWQRKPRRA